MVDYIWKKGFDCPDVCFIQLARLTRSLALYLQQVGRGLLMVVGKEKTIIIDNVGLYNYFGLPDANKKWMHHFIGREDAEHPSHQGKLKCALEDDDYMFDVSRLEEADEEMIFLTTTMYMVIECPLISSLLSRRKARRPVQ